MRKYFALFLAVILIGSISNVHAFTNDNSEKNRLPDNFYPFGKGILEFQESGQCAITIPNYSVKSVNASKPIPLLNIDGFRHNFFAVLGNNIDNSYHYFQIGLPGDSGLPSYLLDVKKDDKRVRGEFYVDYENLAVLIESDVEKKSLPDGNYNRYFEGESKDITANMETYGPGTYNFGAMLLKSAGNSWIKDEKCAIHFDWPFVIEENGDIVAGSPTVDVGQLADVTDEFPPLKQHRAGVNPQSIECKPGLRVILQEIDDSGNKRPACVTLETKEKLIDRGWVKISELAETGSNNTQRLIELLESGQVSEFNKLKETLDLSRTQVSLEGADLHGMDLRKINLERVHIEHASLKNANLEGIVLDYRNIQ